LISVNVRLFDVDAFGYGNLFGGEEQASGEAKASPLNGGFFLRLLKNLPRPEEAAAGFEGRCVVL